MTTKKVNPDWPKEGERWDTLDGTRTCRVMGVVEGYVIARFKGAGPWILHANDWPKRFKRHHQRED